MTDPRLRRRFLFVVPVALLIAAVWLATVVFLAVVSVDRPGTASAWESLFTDAVYRDRLAFSVAQASAAAALGLALGLPASWLLGLRGVPLRPLLTALLISPLAIPGVALALGVEALALHDLRPEALIIGTHALFAGAAVVWLVTPAWRTPDARATEAARLLGASRWRAYRAGSGQQLPRAVRRGVALGFAYAFASVAPVVLLGGADHPTTEAHLAFLAVESPPLSGAGDGALAASPAATALVQVAVVSLVLLAGGIRWPRPSVSARPASGWLVAPGTLYLLGLTAVVVAPLVALIREAALADAFQGLLDAEVDGRAVPSLLGWTAVYAVLAGAGATLLAWPASVALAPARRSVPGTALVLAVALPIALTGAALGWGGGVIADWTGLSLNRTYLVVVIAHILLGYPFALRILGAPRGRSGVQVEEALLLLGQSPRRAAWRGRGRQTAHALLAAGLVSAVLSAGEVGAAHLLTPREATPAALGMLRAADLSAGASSPLHALAALLSIVAVIAFACAEWLRRRAARAEAI